MKDRIASLLREAESMYITPSTPAKNVWAYETAENDLLLPCGNRTLTDAINGRNTVHRPPLASSIQSRNLWFPNTIRKGRIVSCRTCFRTCSRPKNVVLLLDYLSLQIDRWR